MKGRRSDNSGSIFKDKYGYWNGQIRVGKKANGRPQFLRKRSKTEGEVVEWLKEQTAKQHNGEPVAPDKATMEHVLKTWLAGIKDALRYSAYQTYEHHCYEQIIPRIGKVRAKLLNIHHVQDLLFSMARKGLAKNTIRNTRATLRAALDTVKRQYPAAYIAVIDAKMPKTKKERTKKAFTPEQAQQFLIAIEHDRLKALYWTTLLLGLRKGEVTGLKIEDLDLEAKTIYIRRAAQRQKGKGIVEVEPKTKASESPLPLPDVLIPILRAHLDMLVEDRSYTKWKERGLLFPTTVGSYLSTENLSRHFKTVLERASLPDIRFHDLRRSTATLLASMGVPPRVTMEILRHTQIATTLNIYADVVPQANRDALNQLGDTLELQTIELPAKVRKEGA